MRILHIINDLGSGGAEKLLTELLPLLKEKIKKIDLLVLNNHNQFYYEDLRGKIDIKFINYKSNYNIFNLVKIVKEIKKYDIIHSHTFPTNYFVSLAKFFVKDKKFITTEHSTYNNRRKYKIFKIVEKYIYNNYDKIIAISLGTEKALVDWVPSIGVNKIVTIENGINIKKYNQAETIKENFFSKEDKMIVMVGRFTDNKDQETLIKAMALLNRDETLILIGEGKNEYKLKKLTQNLKLENKVKFLGVRNDVQNILKKCKLAIISSKWEGFGLVAVEAMASGIPVIASDVQGLRDVVGDNGILFEAGNEKDLVSKINLIFNSKELYEKIKKNCIKKSKKYDISFMAEKYYYEYKKLYK